MLHLCKGRIRQKLQYGVLTIWAPYLQKDIDAIKGVQRKITRMITSLKDLPYEDRLIILED